MKVLALLFAVFGISLTVLPDYGVPGWTCDPSVMAKSPGTPHSAHAVRFGDIKVVGALGDSLTAANGAGAEPGDPVAVILQYRGLAFQIGGDKSLDEHVTIPNILRKFNPDVFGASNGIGSANVWEIAKLNQGIPGAQTKDLVRQARVLISLMQEHPEINVKEDWKLVNIFIGANDICGYCEENGAASHTPEIFKQNIINAVQLLKDNLPRTIVSLTGMLDMQLVRPIDHQELFCLELHHFECPCEANKNWTDPEIVATCKGFMRVEEEIQSSGMFDTTDDFTFVIQPFLNGITIPPMKDGKIDLSWFAPDCFHFSQLGHANIGKHLWNNIVQPVGMKNTVVNLSDYTIGLHCPDVNCPFFRTTKNSQNCAQYMNG